MVEIFEEWTFLGLCKSHDHGDFLYMNLILMRIILGLEGEWEDRRKQMEYNGMGQKLESKL